MLSKFITQVFDPDFVRSSQRYAKLLVDEIPANKRFDALVTLYRQKLNGDIYNVGLVVHTLIAKLTDDQIKQYLAIVSDELVMITEEKDIRHNLHLLPPNLWEQLSEISRLRVENKVIRAIKDGEASNGSSRSGALATWARGHFRHFTLRYQSRDGLPRETQVR